MPLTNTIAIFAGTKAVSAYLADIVRLAGFDPVIGTEKGAALILVAQDGKIAAEPSLPVIRLGESTAGEGVRVIPERMKASALIDLLQKAMQARKGLPAKIEIGDYTLDTRENLWIQEGEAPLRLTEKETAILACLQAAGAAVSREALLEQVWSYVREVETHTLETHIYRLRQKIEEDPSSPKILITQGDGYSLLQDKKD